MVPPSLPTVAAASLWPVDVEIDVRELYTILPGLLVYPITMALLWAWDTRVLPELQRQMILPYGARDLARMRRKWLLESHTMTPLTSSVTPTLDQILEEPNKCHFIGSYRNVRQYVCVGVRSLDHPVVRRGARDKRALHRAAGCRRRGGEAGGAARPDGAVRVVGLPWRRT